MAREEIINRSLEDKKSDSFEVAFYIMDANIANILGRQIRRVSRPNFTFLVNEYHRKGMKLYDTGRIEFQPIDIEFADDENSMVTNAIYRQVFLQRKANNVLDAAFEMRVKVLNNRGSVIENYVLKQCTIESITHSEQIYEDSMNNSVTVAVRFIDMDYDFPEEPKQINE